MSGSVFCYHSNLPKLSMLLVVLTAVAMWVPGARSFPNGAPVERCQDMLPRHGSNTPQMGNAPVPFSVAANMAYYSAGKKITVMINSTQAGTMFRGLILQARDGSSNPKGTFSAIDQDTSIQFLDCSSMQNSAVTHTDRSDKSSIAVYWMPPSSDSDMGPITFTATVVQEFAIFFVNVTSTPLTYKGDSMDGMGGMDNMDNMDNDMGGGMGNNNMGDSNDDNDDGDDNGSASLVGSFVVPLCAFVLSRLL